MSKLYDCIEEAKASKPDISRFEYGKDDDVYDKLLDIASKNENNPGELPHRFCLINVWVDTEDLKELLRRINLYPSEIYQYNYSCRGYYYQITL